VKTTVNITEAQARLPKLIRSKHTVSVCSRDKTVGFIVPRERMEVLANPEAMRAIRRDRAGKTKYLALSALDEDKGRA
jgi:antitoxin (DNA-binding transcriptional repressor) of toxin-antitoxin stability system